MQLDCGLGDYWEVPLFGFLSGSGNEQIKTCLGCQELGVLSRGNSYFKDRILKIAKDRFYSFWDPPAI